MSEPKTKYELYYTMDDKADKDYAESFRASLTWLNDYMSRHKEFTICNQRPTYNDLK